MKEIWRSIKGYEGIYEVSNLGRVRSLDRFITIRIFRGKIFEPVYDRYGYMQVTLRKDGTIHTFKVHRLVAKAFVPNPNNYPQINHKDENKTNNKASNLEWCTAKYNSDYGTRTKRSREHREKCIKEQSMPILCFKDNILVAKYKSQHEASRKTKVKQGGIASCIRGKSYFAGGYHWEKDNGDGRTTPTIPKKKVVSKKRKITKCFKDGELFRTYDSIIAASKDLSIDMRSIYRSMKNNSPIKGYTFLTL